VNQACYPPLFNGSPEEIAAKIAVLEDPVAFFTIYSGLNAAPFQETVLYQVTVQNRLVLYLPATHGKSTVISKWYVIWRICQNPNVRIILGMKTDTEVSNYARAIRRELTMNKKLRRDFGPFKPASRDARWSDDAIEVYWRQINEPQPTVEFTSSKSIEQVLGHRCDEYIWDDVVTPTTTNTLEQRDKQEAAFNTGINTGPQYLWDVNPEWTPENYTVPFFLNKPEGIYWPTDINLRPCGQPYLMKKGLLEGTSFDPDDLLHRKGREPKELVPGKLYKGRGEGFVVLYFDCWQHDAANNLTEEPLFPSRWSTAELLKESRQGIVDFNKRFRNIAVDESMTVFRKAWIHGNISDGGDFPGCRDYTRHWGDCPYEKEESGADAHWYLSLGLDPSSGRRGEAASWTAFVLIAVDLSAPEPRPRYIIDIYREQMGFEDILSYLLDGGIDAQGKRIEGFYNRYPYNVAMVEQNSFSHWIMLSPRRQTFELNHPGVHVLSMETQVGNKWDPISGVAGTQSMVQDGLVRIPYQSASDRNKAAEFIDQMLIFPEGICDYAMAFWFATLGINDGKSKYRSWSRGGGVRAQNPYYHRGDVVTVTEQVRSNGHDPSTDMFPYPEFTR
jgi:hypothetical protein